MTETEKKELAAWAKALLTECVEVEDDGELCKVLDVRQAAKRIAERDAETRRSALLEAARYCDEEAAGLAATSDAKERAPGATRCAHYLRVKVIYEDECNHRPKDEALLAEYGSKRYEPAGGGRQ